MNTFYENEEMLLGTDGVRWVGVECENSRPNGIAVYTEDVSNIQEVPNGIEILKLSSNNGKTGG